ncbi:hypothetical protein TWF106_004454 [Orbilia oligospora]|uniref:BZIP domain-containing protein n=1 Tax=Orbilia oligospora TaxID=2813651 RepID=A0A7C8QRC5_ORBOL|nr:hypothetical protein TWF788_005524 [Orbilia oligospora]KAF3224254.1 hypothetical protein TWF106_004454 [Orbilia oligospora]
MSHAYPPHSPASSSSDSSDSERHHDEPSRHIGQVSTKGDFVQKSQPYGGMPPSQSSEMSAASSAAPSPDQRASRPLDVSNMLNPTPNKGDGQGARRRNADEAELDTPQRISSTPHQPPFTRSHPPSPTDRYDLSMMKEGVHHGGSFSRSIKQPVPPSAKQRDGPLPMIEPHQSSVSSAGTPPRHPATLASPATGQMHPAGGFPFPPINGQHTQGQPPHSQPSMATSPSSSPFSRTQPPHSLPPSYSQTSPVYPMNPPFHEGHSSSPMGRTNSQPSTYGLHLAGLEGLAIPVDTTAASKLADEKRRRNAGASARFRQRRKEREREMGARIVELETRLKVVEEERDHYRNLAMRYAGTPLPNTISSSLGNPQQQISRHNNHGLQLSPRTMARANQPHLMNEGPYTSPAYAHVREDSLASPGIPLSRTLSTEGRRVGRAYSAGQVYPNGMPVGAHDGPDRPLMEAYNVKSRNGSLHHPRPQSIPEHINGRDIKTEWGSR